MGKSQEGEDCLLGFFWCSQEAARGDSIKNIMFRIQASRLLVSLPKPIMESDIEGIK